VTDSFKIFASVADPTISQARGGLAALGSYPIG